MIYSNELYRPSANMNLNGTIIHKMINEQKNEIYKQDQEKKLREQLQVKQALQEHANEMAKYQQSRIVINNRPQFLQKVKTTFLTECMMKLYKDSCVTPMNNTDEKIARNLIVRFINENGGAGDMINRFATKNMILSEMSRICDKYYRMVLESCDKNCKECGDIKELTLDKRATDGFYEELEKLDTEDVSKMIKDRISDSLTEFVDTNMNNKMEYEEMIRSAKDKASSTKDDAVAEGYINMARRNITDMKMNQSKGIFHIMTESLVKHVLTDDELRPRYIHEASVDMDGVVHNVELIYTMLEMANTTDMVNVNEQFLQDYLANLA